MTTKLIDGKGRLMLGSSLAGRMVLVDDSDPDHIIVTPAVAIPEKEAWLFKNEEALELVRKGLKELAAGEFSDSPPDLAKDAALADQLD